MQRAMAAAAAGGGTSRTLVLLSLPSTIKYCHYPILKYPTRRNRVLQGFNFRPLCTATSTVTTATTATEGTQQLKHSILLERLRQRHLKASTPSTEAKNKTLTAKQAAAAVEGKEGDGLSNKSFKKGKKILAGSFEEVGLSEELMGAVREMEIEVPTEIQCTGIPAVLDGKSVVLGSHTGSGKTLAYMLPLVQLLRHEEAQLGMLMKPRRPRAVVLCPTRELSEQVFRVAKSISHHARFRSTMVSGGGRLRPQEDSLNTPIDMIVGTPGRVLQHIADGNMVYGDIRYLVLDEADTMFDRGFGPEIRKFLGPLKNRASKPGGQGFQTILVTATMTKAVQKLIDEEFQGILHLHTSSLHKKIASARHDFIKLSGSENKLEALLQVLEPSLTKGNRVMVFCNTLNSSRAVDHFLAENQISTVNYHGEVPAEQRVENLKKFKSDDADCPTLVCTDLAARGLDLDVDHVIMFDFPLNSIDYLHRTGRTARMGAKGKVTSLVAKRDLLLASRIEEAIRKNESLESLTVDNVRRDSARAQITGEKGKNARLVKTSNRKKSSETTTGKPRSSVHTKVAESSRTKSGKASSPLAKSAKAKVVVKRVRSSGISDSKRASPGAKKQQGKLKVVAFRGRSSSGNKEAFKRPG